MINSTDTGASQVALVVKNPPANAGDLRDAGLIPGSGRYAGENCVAKHNSRNTEVLVVSTHVLREEMP